MGKIKTLEARYLIFPPTHLLNTQRPIKKKKQDRQSEPYFSHPTHSKGSETFNTIHKSNASSQMNLALSFIGLMVDVPIPCVTLNLPFMREAVQGPRCSHSATPACIRAQWNLLIAQSSGKSYPACLMPGLKHQIAQKDMRENWKP